ncbi:24794_t:CDS:2, partial [Cetraspora pellucida]
MKFPHQSEIMYPHDIYIPKNFIIPSGNVFKFKLYASGFVWYKCNSVSSKWGLDQFRSVYFNHKEDFTKYPYTGVAFIDFRATDITIRSAIPKYDNSTMTLTLNGFLETPSSDPTKNYRYEFVPIKSNTGKGAFSDVTYFIVAETDGGAPPPSTECGTTYPDGFIHPELITYTLLYYHPGTDPYMK